MKYTYIIAAVLLFTSGNIQAQNSKDIANGARLWASTCTRCHSARSPMERTASEWKPIINHMRARANLTKTEAKAIAAYFEALAPKSTSAALQAPSASQTQPAFKQNGVLTVHRISGRARQAKVVKVVGSGL